MNQYIIVADTGLGAYGHDAQGNPWSSFLCNNYTATCAVCGASIASGWVRGRIGEEQIRVCSDHVTVMLEKKD